MNSLATITMIRKVSFFFFLALGVLHFIAYGFYSKQQFLPYSNTATRVLYIPFLLAALSYAYGVLKEYLLMNGRSGKTLDYCFLGFTILVIGGLLYLQFAFPDLPFKNS